MEASDVIRQTILAVVNEHDQPEQVAELIANWYRQILVGNESILSGRVANKHAAFQHLERIFEAMASPWDKDTGDVR